ncbi:hypothetical protein EIN_334390 [Entamoeba invadens IP1]|uniref:Uncharacterized protein n=1 Tax=Entamoeba invadens IP1 TaxID=370355 RepID=A0A0A1UB63_ENTIV|nr:hypothetical protein EIN_334390 [Entamoeba invadens IP1]ELP92442.1 hypothetical protein EIN_334390 [Entamoeba invadens IP1]|eukprot:XP_004259213.1 hypothetical protein EIN_334390 [Entamoeba invadens IP1]
MGKFYCVLVAYSTPNTAKKAKEDLTITKALGEFSLIRFSKIKTQQPEVKVVYSPFANSTHRPKQREIKDRKPTYEEINTKEIPKYKNILMLYAHADRGQDLKNPKLFS